MAVKCIFSQLKKLEYNSFTIKLIIVWAAGKSNQTSVGIINVYKLIIIKAIIWNTILNYDIFFNLSVRAQGISMPLDFI